MIKQILVVLLAALSCADAFAPPKTQRQSKSALSLAAMPPPPPTPVNVASVAQQRSQLMAPSEQLNQGIQSYLQQEKDLSSTSVTLSLQERKPPTPEEIAAKKRNFNLWLWGGGFVAPMLATFYCEL